MKLDIQLFGGRGASSGSGKRGVGSGFLGEQKGGFGGSDGTRFFAGDTVTKNGKEYRVTDTRGGKMELYSGDKTLKINNTSGITLKERGTVGLSLLAKERVTVVRGADSRMQINGRNVAVYNKTPKGFSKTSGATTAPKGYSWYSNNKSLFGDERISILVKNKKRK